jgi:P-aminobenzoate N-oxygenase AurF
MHAIEPAADRYTNTLAQLSRASVRKHFDAYADVGWDDPEFRIDPEDPRFECAAYEPIAASPWYRQQKAATRARIGLALSAFRLKMGIEFENLLSRGLLEFAASLKNGSPEFRYAYHELIEEAQHSLMFQEFVNRSGCDSPGLPWAMKWLARQVPRLGRVAPELLFVHVLAGEVPIDRVQRIELKRGAALHPLLRRIVQIHVTEEARHVHFAESFLEARVPALSPLRRAHLSLAAPIVTAIVADLMLRPPAAVVARFGMPRAVLAEAYRGPAYAALRAVTIAPLYERYTELGLITRASRPLWRALPLRRPGGASGNALSSGTPQLPSP